MTKKELLDLIWEKVADEQQQALKDSDHYANIGDFLDAKKCMIKYEALNQVRDFLHELYRNSEIYR